MPEILRSYGQNATNFYGLAKRLKARSEWRMGKMWAHSSDRSDFTVGQLPADKRQGLGWADYVIYSYDTPIAWHVSHGNEEYWVQPDVKYSRTTTTHQGKIAVALSVMDKV